MNNLSPYEKEQARYKEEYSKKRKKHLLISIASIILLALFFIIVPEETRIVIYMMSLLPLYFLIIGGITSSGGYERDIRGEQEFLREIGEQCIDCDHNFVYATKTKKEAVNQMFGHSYRRCPKCEKKYGVYKSNSL